MPKLGIKCFLGSFLLSLAAVFVAAKAYILWSFTDAKQAEFNVAEIETKNIELFAASEENDPIYEKFRQLEAESKQRAELAAAEHSDGIIETAASDEVLFTPDTEDDSSQPLALAQNDTEGDILTGADENEEISTAAAETATENNELQIADASEAPDFAIPLVHNYQLADNNVTVSSSADKSQIALASHNVALDNLGTENMAAAIQNYDELESLSATSEMSDTLSAPQLADEDDPWEVAETANKHAGKNSLDAYAAAHKTDAQALNPPVSEANGSQVAYKMQRNLLIPIPEDIMNNKNLTPQLSSSEENLRLEEELRAKNQLPPREEDAASITNQPTPEVGDVPDLDDNTEIDEETSKSLTDSIAEWFSSTKKKTPKDNIAVPQKSPDAQNNRDQKNSIFSKLLGIESEKNVTPTELKLAFQPNRAEISGQTLEWLHAFSDNAVKYENVVVEIRISKSAPYELQQKRLKLLYRILANNGVDYDKINIIFTDREPNSFIIRNVRYATEEEKTKAVKKADNPWY